MLKNYICLGLISFSLLLGVSSSNAANSNDKVKIEEMSIDELNHQIRRDKFDKVLPMVMEKNGVDMWIHVMRTAIEDSFGAEELGTTSGVVVFTNKGNGRIERAVLGRRWGSTQRFWDDTKGDVIKASGAYDVIYDAVPVQEPVGSVLSEFDYRFKGLKEFVEARNPKKIAVNFLHDLGPWVTFRGGFAGMIHTDGLSHTDYVLLTEELGAELSDKLMSSEYLMMDYIINKVPSEIELLKRNFKAEVKRIKDVFAEVEPGKTPNDTEDTFTTFRRMSTGLSQRGRSIGWENSVVNGGDIIMEPMHGLYAYVLREGETEPPPDIQKIWKEYLKIDKILAEEIKSGLTANEILKNAEKRFAEEGVVIRDNQMHMIQPQNNFPVYTVGFDPELTHLTLDCHGMMKGARNKEDENYFGPRIGTLGPDWARNIELPNPHHFVLEYFFYMPSPTNNPEEDQYLFWWDHEIVVATENGVQYFAEPQKELILIK